MGNQRPDMGKRQQQAREAKKAANRSHCALAWSSGLPLAKPTSLADIQSEQLSGAGNWQIHNTIHNTNRPWATCSSRPAESCLRISPPVIPMREVIPIPARSLTNDAQVERLCHIETYMEREKESSIRRAAEDEEAAEQCCICLEEFEEFQQHTLLRYVCASQSSAAANT